MWVHGRAPSKTGSMGRFGGTEGGLWNDPMSFDDHTCKFGALPARSRSFLRTFSSGIVIRAGIVKVHEN